MSGQPTSSLFKTEPEPTEAGCLVFSWRELKEGLQSRQWTPVDNVPDLVVQLLANIHMLTV